jgi:hypothetical protein
MSLTDREWKDLLSFIAKGGCTPFIGAGASASTLPLGAQLAQSWAERNGYPLKDSYDLARVAQFLSIDRYPMFPKDQVQEIVRGAERPNFSDAKDPHGALADLPLPVYVTTNYDDNMFQALEERNRQPKREFCRWNKYAEVVGKPSVLKQGFKPTVANPLVFHLHGHHQTPQSMVLTEDDYLNFLIRVTESPKLLPPVINTALTKSLLFVGYSLSDWTFRVLFRGLINSIGASLGYLSVAIQLPPMDVKDGDDAMQRAQDYLGKYFSEIQQLKLVVYWGDARQFAEELRQRWGDYKP